VTAETKYLIDNNALGPLGDRKKSAFFAKHCRVPDEVAYESRRAKHATLLRPVTIEMTPAMLTELARVMKTVPVGDTDLINLYTNKGAADPILVAMASILSSADLFADNWVIVTEDKAVRAKAKEFGIGLETPAGLKAIIDAAQP
jgi:hypothetical protein